MPPRSAPPPDRLVELVRRQDGLVTRGQATAAGMTAHRVEGNLKFCRWARVLPEVYLTTGAKPDEQQSSGPSGDRPPVVRLSSEPGVRRRQHTSGRLLGFLGETTVNVLELNMELDRQYPFGG